MPIALSPSHPRYGKVPARGGGAARKSTPLANNNAHGATSINIPMASAHASTPTTPPRHSRRPSTSSSSSSNSFGFDRSPPINQAFLDALEAPVTPTRPSQSAAFPLARSLNRGAPTASIRTRAADALLPPAVVGGPTERNARFHPRHARQSPPTTPTRRDSTRPTRPCPRARQVKPLAASTRAPDAAQNAEAGPSKGKGKRRAEDSEDDESSGLASPKRARTASTPSVPINQNAIESAITEPEPAPQPEPAPAPVARAVRVEKRRMEDGPLLSPPKRIRFAVDAPPAKLPALATLLEEAEDEDAAGPPSEFQLGGPGSTSPARGPRAQGPDDSPSARVKAQRSPRPSVLRPSAFRSAHDRRAAPHARCARPRTAGARTSPHLEESPVAQASRRLQEITSEDTNAAAPGSAHALLRSAGVVRVYCTESEIAQELFGSDEDLDFQSGQGAPSQVAASVMDWATESVDAEETYYEDTVMASPSASPGPRGRTLSSSMDMDVDPPGSLDIGVQDEVRDETPPAYLRPFRVDKDGDVIMHGPCTLRLPSDRRALKIFFASEVRKRRVEASDKRRRSHLLR
ncbi:hypothetical protein BOTBODRAFT_178802 [Botryobasidium botryosum FD-172 SS1]|uniref:Uncharacterized protein n=1 Tax=Botryobasidium botryosum (strain FD-172 SS1) TaxID=930990 RepID=A0A067MDR9_BOTB1|nr:hypothetical protein BOTBODRAFT_178802 [Botryobasidium botryosum FD-172 SS1]